MNLNLGPVFDQFVADLLEPGLYQSQSEILREGLRLLKEREDLKQLHLASLRIQINEGAAEADRGESVKASAVFAQLRKKSACRQESMTLRPATNALIA